MIPLATYEDCGGCGGTGLAWDPAAGEFSGTCYTCRGKERFKVTTLARKDHTCTLCGKPIPKGEEYINQTIRPWDHSDNEGFSTYKAHVACDTVWRKVGDRHDWVFPDDPYEWARELARHAGGDTP